MPPVRGEKNNSGANPVWHIPLCFESEFEALKTSLPPALRMVQLAAPGMAGQFCCKNRSEFSAPKTAPSHGLTGFVAIESVARKGAKRMRAFAARAWQRDGKEAGLWAGSGWFLTLCV